MVRLITNLHIKFFALNPDFNSSSFDPLDLGRPAHAGVKKCTPLNVVILPLLTRLE